MDEKYDNPISEQILIGLEREVTLQAVSLCIKMESMHVWVKRMNEIVLHVINDQDPEEFYKKLIIEEGRGQDEGF